MARVYNYQDQLDELCYKNPHLMSNHCEIWKDITAFFLGMVYEIIGI